MNLLSLLGIAGFALTALVLYLLRGADEFKRLTREHTTAEAARTDAKGGA